MFPGSALQDSAYDASSGSAECSDTSLTEIADVTKTTDFPGLLAGDRCIGVILAPDSRFRMSLGAMTISMRNSIRVQSGYVPISCCRSFPLSHVSHVFSMGAYSEVRGIAARRLIARMEYFHAIRNGTNQEFINDAVGKVSDGAPSDQTITVNSYGACPKPACIAWPRLQALPDVDIKRAFWAKGTCTATDKTAKASTMAGKVRRIDGERLSASFTNDENTGAGNATLGRHRRLQSFGVAPQAVCSGAGAFACSNYTVSGGTS